MELKRVVVTGLGAVTPLGNSVEETWKNLINGVSGAGPITHFDSSLFKTQFACEVKNFNAADFMDKKEARKIDLFTQYAIAVAKGNSELLDAINKGLETVKENGTYDELVDKYINNESTTKTYEKTGNVFIETYNSRNISLFSGINYLVHQGNIFVINDSVDR